VDDTSYDRTYQYASSGSLTIDNFGMNTANTSPRGAASTSAGKKVWVVDANKTVYVYGASGSLLGSWTAGGLTSTAQIEGITTNGTDIWLVDNKQDKVFKYTGAASLLSGSQSASSSFNLNGSNTSPKDLVTDGTSIWVVNDSTTDKVFKYSLYGSPLGSWTISTPGASSPTGITLNPAIPSALWIVDNGTDMIYQYDAAVVRTFGSQAASTNFVLAVGNTNPQGIADPPVNGDEVASMVTTLDNHRTTQLSTGSNSMFVSPLVEFTKQASSATPRFDSQDRDGLPTKIVTNQSQTQSNRAVNQRTESESCQAITQVAQKIHDRAFLDLLGESFDLAFGPRLRAKVLR